MLGMAGNLAKLLVINVSSLLCGKLARAVVVVRREGKELMATRSIGQ